MINQKLMVSGADYFADTYEINPYYTQSAIDIEKAKAEHALILDCFREAGIELVKVDPPKDCQDGVYTANWALVKDGVAVLARLPEARRAEEAVACKYLQEQGIKVVQVPDNYLYSGQGDSLRCGKYLIGGRGYRSDPEAQQFAAETLGLELVQVHAKPQLNSDGSPHINPYTNHADSFWYDLDLAVSVIDEQITTSAQKVSLIISSAPASMSLCPIKLQSSKPNSKSVALSASRRTSPSLKRAVVTFAASVSGLAKNYC